VAGELEVQIATIDTRAHEPAQHPVQVAFAEARRLHELLLGNLQGLGHAWEVSWGISGMERTRRIHAGAFNSHWGLGHGQFNPKTLVPRGY
jgi:hypothetical protein